jgi:hypothetical protein
MQLTRLLWSTFGVFEYLKKATAHSFSVTCLLSIAVGLQMQDMWFKIRREKAFRNSQAGTW